MSIYHKIIFILLLNLSLPLNFINLLNYIYRIYNSNQNIDVLLLIIHLNNHKLIKNIQKKFYINLILHKYILYQNNYQKTYHNNICLN